MRKICLRCGSKFGGRAEYCPHDGSQLVTDEDIADPILGTVLLEQFRIDEQIGTGGMGTVYRAHQTTVGRDVAIKVLRPELARDEQAVFRFEREARLAISLDHPNLVRVFLSGRLPNGRLYIVMELLEGRSLAEELEENGLLSIERALIIIMKLCAGLGAVHAAGIVHRDIKPENVHLVKRGMDDDFVKLVDFGIARVLESEGIGPTTSQSGRVFGTATYISPEAATGEQTDQRSDIYSLGVLTYQLLSGELPFVGKTAGAVLMQHVHQDAPLLQSKGRGASVSDEVCQVVMQSLSKDPEARQQSLSEFLDSLAEAAGGAGLLKDARALLLGTIWGDDLAAPGSYLADLLGSSAPPGSPSPLAATQPVPVAIDPDEEALLSAAPKPFGTTSYELAAAPKRKKKRFAWLWGALALLALISFGVVGRSWWTHRQPPPVSEEPRAEAVPPPAVEAPEPDAPVADVGTDVLLDEAPVVEEVIPESPAIEAPAPAEEPPHSKPKLKAKKKRPKKKRPAPLPAKVSEPQPAPGPALEPDEGIDWTVPDFPEPPSAAEPSPEASPRPDAAPAAESLPPSKPPPPTGTPDAPARNPVVIDEPPAP